MDIRRPHLLTRHTRRIAVDLVLIPCAFCLALLIRCDGHCTVQAWETLTWYLLPITLVFVISNAVFGIYRRLWIHASFYDIIILTAAMGLGTLILVVSNALIPPQYFEHRLPTGVLIVGGLLTLISSVAVKYRHHLIVALSSPRPISARSGQERVLIVGVNETARQAATQITQKKSRRKYRLVGFVDDDPNGQGMNLNGVSILGTTDQIRSLVREERIDVIIIAHRPSDQEEMWRLISSCQETAARVKVLPRDMVEMIEGRYEDPLTLRDVSIEDILRRPPATVDIDSCLGILAGKVVLVTGAAGSIGSELCRQILDYGPSVLIILDNNETGLYELQLEVRPHSQTDLRSVIADITDWRKMERVFQGCKPHAVFHAAAYKHVPLMEYHPEEAFRVNLLGTVVVSELARENRVKRFVFVSTDKAVNPSCVMGASKRIGELWIQSLAAESDTVFTAVRFGNVFGSRGSVVPTFARQIELGGPLTITHPDMSRFFMSIPEAASLVLQAAAFAQHDEIFMLDMGEEVSILDLAQRMIRLKGLRIRKDIEIEIVGIRPGEKLHEQLAYFQESREGTQHPSIYRLHDTNSAMDRQALLAMMSFLACSTHLHDGDQLMRDGIFQIASQATSGLLFQMAGTDIVRNWRQLADCFYGTMAEGKAKSASVNTTPTKQSKRSTLAVPQG